MIGLAWRKASAGESIAFDDKGAPLVERGHGTDSGHGVFAPFEMQRSPLDPIMAGMPSRWMHADDELYYGLRGPAENIEVLATALSPVTHLNEPMAWTVRFGTGRCFATALGHDVNSMRCIGFQTLIARGCEWAGVEPCHSTCREVSREKRSVPPSREPRRWLWRGNNRAGRRFARISIGKCASPAPMPPSSFPSPRVLRSIIRQPLPWDPTATCMSPITPAKSSVSTTPTAMVWKTPPRSGPT